MKKIVVLGSTGMLGNAVGKYFLSQPDKYQTYLSYRNKDVSYGKNKFKFDPLVDSLNKIPKADFIINCIGVTKPNIDKNKVHSIIINSLFPWQLADHAQKTKAKLIHITTDCVFSGKGGNYHENSEHDALDFYGKSKSLGEPNKTMVLRTSIIGEEIHNHANLLAWVKSMAGKDINGFTNHLWNGITTNQYAKLCEKIINNNMYEPGIFHIFSNRVNKFKLLQLLDKKFNLRLKIKKYQTDVAINRILATTKDLQSKLEIPTIEKMIKEI